MSPFGLVLYNVLLLFSIVLVARVVMELVFGFARSYQPRGAALVALEVVFSITDPPLKALRRIIPPLRIGSISLDLAVLVLFLLVFVGMQLALLL